jgi:FkbM family methyltransferase
MNRLLAGLDRVFEVPPITLLDIGSRWGLQRPWGSLPLDKLVYHGFDADEEECARLNAEITSGGAFTYHPFALSDRLAQETLFLAESSGLSSIFRPDFSRVNRYCSGELNWRTVREIPLKTKRLDSVLAEQHIAPDFMKIDTQGAELKIMQGAGDYMDSLLGLELEVEFVSLYVDQPLFADIDIYARQKGFELFDLNRYWANRNTLESHTSRRGQVIFGDAIYFRSIESFYALPFASTETKTERLLQLAVMLSIYGHFDAALEYLQHPETPLAATDLAEIKNLLNLVSSYPLWQRILFNNRVANRAGRFIQELGSSLRYRTKTFGWGTDYNAEDGRYRYFRSGSISTAR